MKFTFGIITDGQKPEQLRAIVDSICNNVPGDKCEIIIVGGNSTFLSNEPRITHVTFDETVKPAWITRKKNLITRMAKYENVVYMHDYIEIGEDWYDGFLEFGDDFDVCMTRILNVDGSRYRDWVTWWDYSYTALSLPNAPGMVLPPYTYKNTRKMYISGAYWVGKRWYMLKYPLDEEKSWGQGEDVEWSLQRRETWNYKMNPLSTVALLKYKDKVFPEVSYIP